MKKKQEEISGVLLDWSMSYLESGRFIEAVFALEETTRLNPGDPLAWAALAMAAALSGDREKARRYFLELKARNPNGKYVNRVLPFLGHVSNDEI